LKIILVPDIPLLQKKNNKKQTNNVPIVYIERGRKNKFVKREKKSNVLAGF